jgi:excinuclease ABC subunit C
MLFMPRLALDNSTESLFDHPDFTGFGPSRFHVDGVAPGGQSIHGRRPVQLRAGVREQAPRRPGVYAMLDPRGRLIYVGKAKCLRTRLLSYFRTASRDPKAGRIINKTRRLLWEFAGHELAALLRELELIQRHRPRYNVIGLPGLRRYCYVAIGRPDAASVYVTAEPTGKEIVLYGPLIGRGRVAAGVRRLNDAYRLRDCRANFPMHFSDQQALFDAEQAAGCLRYDLGTCLGPCGGGCSRRSYGAAVRKARAFLDGRDSSLLGRWNADMAAASAALQFEKAALIRDKLAELEWLRLRLAMLRTARHASSFVYPLAMQDGRSVWYLLHRGRVWSVISAPESSAAIRQATATIALMLSDAGERMDMVTHVDSVLLVAAWFRKRAGEKALLRPAEAVLAELTMAAERMAA